MLAKLCTFISYIIQAIHVKSLIELKHDLICPCPLVEFRDDHCKHGRDPTEIPN